MAINLHVGSTEPIPLRLGSEYVESPIIPDNSITDAKLVQEGGVLSAVDALEERVEAIEDDYAKAEDLNTLADELEADLIDKADVIVSHAEGSIASFSDGGDDLPVKKLEVEIVPKQAGSGDPSPSNVRPIAGSDGVTVRRTGKNLLQNTLTTKTVSGVTLTVNADGTIASNGTASALVNETLNPIELKGGTVYYLNGCPSGGGGSSYELRVRDSDYNVLTSDVGSGNAFTPSKTGTYYVALVIRSGANVSGKSFSPMVCLNSEADKSFEPYSGTTLSTQFPSTVYGGEVDLVSGVMRVDRKEVDLGLLSWTYNSTYTRFETNITDAKIVGNSVPINGLCSIYKIVSGFAVANTDMSIGIVTTPKLLVHDSRYTNSSTFATAVTGQKLVYELATPTEIQLTAQDLETLKGVNNVWADTGDVSVDYRADTKLYIDGKLAELIAQIVNS